MSLAVGTALVRPPGPRLADGIVTHLRRTLVDVDVARGQHRAYVATLQEAGCVPVAVEPADEHPDAVFVEDEGIRQFERLLAPLGRTVVPVPLGPVPHLKSAATALPDGTVVGQGHLVDVDVLPAWHEVDEVTGSHVVLLGGDTLLMAASAPRTATWLAHLGYDVATVDIGELEKLEGCVTCLSVLIPGR